MKTSPDADLWQALFFGGRLVLEERPSSEWLGRSAVRRVLREAHQVELRALSNPNLPWDEEMGLSALQFLMTSAWLVLKPAEAEAMASPPVPEADHQHLAADLSFRFLPRVLSLAQRRKSATMVMKSVAGVLASFPYSGVLADLDEPPLVVPEFKVPALQMRYAERWCVHPKASWLPTGKGYEYVEYVWADLGRDSHELAGLREAPANQELRQDDNDVDQ